MATSLDITPLIRSLERRDTLSDAEKAVLARGPWRLKTYAAGAEIVAQGSEPKESCVILEGITGRVIRLSDGRRQITALHVPGDFVDFHALLLRVMDHGVEALTPMTTAWIGHNTLRQISEDHAHLFRTLSTLSEIDGAIQRAWIACLGRRSATANLAHLFCELYLRLELTGAAANFSFAFAVTQSTIADALGLSSVHVNRVAQELRGWGLITWERHGVTILDWDRLVAFAEFDPTFLNLKHERR